MAVSATTPSQSIASLGQQSTTSSTSSAGNSDLGKDAFLKLLVAQLRYQDPLNPADGTQFMAQTAQFTMVEKLGDLVTSAQSTAITQKLNTASALIGRQVTYLDSKTGKTVDGLVSSATVDKDTTYLNVAGIAVPIEMVLSVAAPPTTTDTKTTGTKTS